jgi:orotidine-5'-phosphate decarboxylase
MEQSPSKIIVALDFDAESKTLAFVDRVDPKQCRVKVGKELFTRCGPSLVKQLVARDFDVFLDLKFHDIPNTVAHAVAAAADLGVWMTNVHASGGSDMMNAARASIATLSPAQRPILIAVTVLTSLSAADLQAVGVSASPAEQVLNLARLAQNAGLDGVVCSAAETAALRCVLGADFCLVTPGIRRPEDATGDQKRVVGPAEAIANGSDYLVVGRPITQAEVPLAALADFNRAVSGS